ncbi:sensor histidine kinase [Pedobacter namyangjuensis]|uniref:sensor histidine kinase n=1 Tax=Pedobacter namyangjuensis TaxID=600626 RepID=UPI000DE50006|nr:HAMP domain-containing sensor histidine kinase [Pedobacter namyangjuensis]
MPKSNFSSLINISLLRKNIFWSELIGKPSEFSLESRIFHGISLGILGILVIYAPYNLFAGLYVGSFSALFIAIFFAYQYYQSRFKLKPHDTVVFGLMGIAVFGVNYFYNSGIHGSTDLIWPAYLLMVLAISPYQHHLKWLLFYMLCFVAIHILEFYHPDLVRYPFSVGRGQFIDRVTAFPIPVVAIFIIIKFIRKSHDNERKIIEEKTIAIEASKQQILLQKEELEERNIEKNKLMSVISHDLKTPLINVQNYMAMLAEKELDDEDRPALEQHLLKSTNDAMDLLSNLLNWSKSQMEGLNVNLREQSLLSTLVSTIEVEKIYASKKDISLSYQIPSHLKVVADVDMLQLVVRNLISNAVKFTPQGGLVIIDAQICGEDCKITVSDNGCGIAKDKQENIFSVKSAPSYGTNNERGVGLGLVLCKEFMERQGGRVTFESELGKGSSFSVFVKLKQAENISLNNPNDLQAKNPFV